MMKLVIAGATALLLGVAAASAAPIRAPALGQAIDSATTQVGTMEHRSMHRGYRMHHRHMRYGMMRRHHHVHRGYMKRHY
ncbi:MAG: hypothetical protein QOH65_585 [Methylobacteriaceae bacterium]|jgi:hypothetical protein|nr:hypothetical protein [Methylobacteriaceae bacterium]